MNMKNTVTEYWGSRSKGQKTMVIGSALFIILLIVALALFAFNTKYIPLYNNLAVEEVNQIKEELDDRSVPYQIDQGGTVIKVPEQHADELLVDLAGQNIPRNGGIDYSFFSENASWGITDNEFNMMRLDATQTELSNLITQIDGIQDANVMITLPEETVFINDHQEEATAAIMLDTDPGYELKGNQVDSLKHLVSKAVPHLPAENISIMNQFFEYYDDGNTYDGENQYTYQQSVQKDIERDIQRRLQQMIGSMVGMDKVIVSVTTDVDFTSENRMEELIEPVDVDNMEGLPVSVETIHETYTGSEGGGVSGTGDTDVPNYPGASDGDDGEYELVKEMINNEFNRIHKEIVESPYKIRDVGIQVAVDRAVDTEEDELVLLSAQEQTEVEEGITSILHSIIQTSVDKEYDEVDPSENISIVFQEFSETPTSSTPTSVQGIPLWAYILAAVLILLIIGLMIALLRKGKTKIYTDEDLGSEEVAATTELPEMEQNPDNDVEVRRKQLEQMATDNPEEFTKLLRSWIADD